MSAGRKFPFDDALGFAKVLVDDLTPHVARVKVAGSLRRRRPEVSDLELVVEPVSDARADLFGVGQGPDLEIIRHTVETWGQWVKGGDRYMQVTHALGVEGLNVDVFVVHPPAEWGTILAIRTGPAKLGEEAVSRMWRYKRRCREGHVIDVHTGQTYPTPTEEDFFRAAGLRCVPPAKRHLPEAFIGLDEQAWNDLSRPKGALAREQAE